MARGDVFLTAKVWVGKHGSIAFPRSVGESLRKLRTDSLDLLPHRLWAAVPLVKQVGTGSLEHRHAA
jgi:diketogulonate reductase-like aldo/keto reductase